MFEFDPKKSQINEQKHGINFIDAQQLWFSPGVILESKFTEESRFLLIGEFPAVVGLQFLPKEVNQYA